MYEISSLLYVGWLHNWWIQVFKGEKMAGHMGAVRRTVKNVWIHKIEPEMDLVWVRGQVHLH
jgi:large subunit ribosomal protein L3